MCVKTHRATVTYIASCRAHITPHAHARTLFTVRAAHTRTTYKQHQVDELLNASLFAAIEKKTFVEHKLMIIVLRM